MAVEWTGLGPDLLLRLDRAAGATLGGQLQEQLRDAIRSGRLGAGERLPSSRNLARELGVSRGLVVDCYAQLEAEGYLDSKGGSATRVAGSIAAPPTTTPAAPLAARPDIDFAYGVPDLSRFPIQDWLWALAEAARRAPFAAGGYGDPHGAADLREVLAAYLRRVRGAAALAEHLVICGGYAQGLGLVVRVLAARGIDVVATEEPHSIDDDAIIEHAGLGLVTVPVDDRGLDVEALAATDARLVIVTPAHQAPTGVALPPERRHALVAWANRVDGYVIEDDYDAEYRYDRQPVGAMQGLAPDRVFSIGSTSKSLAPALRLGWIVCPPALAAAVAQEKALADRGSPGLDQLALAELIRSGRYDRHLRRMRGLYAARRETLATSLAELAPAVRVGGLAAGIHAVLHLQPGADEQAIVAAARERSVGLYGMSRWRRDRAATPPQLVLGFGNVSEHQVRRGIELVADLLQPGGA
jgi:GntR family transcriptional regulator/MocR family aminotransferase